METGYRMLNGYIKRYKRGVNKMEIPRKEELNNQPIIKKAIPCICEVCGKLSLLEGYTKEGFPICQEHYLY